MHLILIGEVLPFIRVVGRPRGLWRLVFNLYRSHNIESACYWILASHAANTAIKTILSTLWHQNIIIISIGCLLFNLASIRFVASLSILLIV